MGIGSSWRSRLVLYVVIGLFVMTLPIYADSPIVSLFTKILIYALLAMSLDILVGYAGLWSFCHAIFFGTGAYTVGILITRYDITSFWLVALAGILMAMIVAGVVGFIALRVSAIYFLIITFALGQLAYNVADRWDGMTGGRYGITGVPYPDFLGFSWYSPVGFYYFVLVVVILCAVLLYFLIKSIFGVSLQGIRENELRMRTLGYNTWLYKYLAFIVSGLFAGLAGVLYIYFYGAIHSGQVSVGTTAFIWLMLIVGGSGTLWGAVVGSVVIALIQYFASIFTPERWPLIMGVLLIASVVLVRGGIFPRLSRLWMKVTQR